MKLKDIKVGEEYAIGAPNRVYNNWRLVRGRVTKVGVHGITSGGWSSSMSHRANYVEFERIECEDSALVDYTYRHQIAEDPACERTGGERTPSRGGLGPRKGEILHDVLRAMGTHVQMTWADFVVRLREHEEHEVKAAEAKDVRELEAAEIRERFQKLGFTAGEYHAGCFEFSTEDAMRILLLLEHHTQAVKDRRDRDAEEELDDSVRGLT